MVTVEILVDYDFFTNDYGSTRIDTEEFTSLVKRAQNLIIKETNFRLNEDWFNAQEEAIQGFVKLAICSQIEYMFETGGVSEATASSVNSARIGDFEYSKGTRSNASIKQEDSQISRDALDYLFFTSLMYARVGVKW